MFFFFFSQAHVLAQFGPEFLQSSFLVFADRLQLEVFILESVELLDGQGTRGQASAEAPGGGGGHATVCDRLLFTFFSALICMASVPS